MLARRLPTFFLFRFLSLSFVPKVQHEICKLFKRILTVKFSQRTNTRFIYTCREKNTRFIYTCRAHNRKRYIWSRHRYVTVARSPTFFFFFLFYFLFFFLYSLANVVLQALEKGAFIDLCTKNEDELVKLDALSIFLFARLSSFVFFFFFCSSFSLFL